MARVRNIGGQKRQHSIDGKPMHTIDIFLGIEVHAQHVFHHHLVGYAVDGQRGNQGENVIGGNTWAESTGVLAQEQQAVEVEG